MDTLPDLLGRFDSAIDSGDRPGACQLLGEVLALTGDRCDVLAAYGQLLLELGQIDAAAAAALRSSALDPAHAETLTLQRRVRSALHARPRDPLPEPVVERLSDAAVYYDMGSDRTVVWFGGIEEPFLSTTLLTRYNVNGVFLRDLAKNWYTEGLLGLGWDDESSVAWLGDFLASKGAQRVAFAGQSSGGYAALRYAHALVPNVCIAFAPQTRNRTNAQGSVVPPFTLMPLDLLYLHQQPDTPIVLHLSRSESKNPFPVPWEDWEQIAWLKELNHVTIVRHPFDQHTVSLPLYGMGAFYDILDADFRIYGRKTLWVARPA